MLLPYFNIMLFLFTSYFSVTHIKPSEPQNRIMLDPSMIINEKAFGNAEALVDEQNLGEGTLPKSVWKTGWIDRKYFPVSAVIDLGKEYFVTDISLFDGQGEGKIIIQSGKPFQWEEDFTYDQKSYNSWVIKPLNKKTQFIRIEVEDGIFPYEIRLYGVVVGATKSKKAPAIAAPKIPKPTMDKLIGINAFIDDPIDRIKVASFIREYHNWGWDASDIKYPHNVYAWNPSNAGGGWNFDQFYSTLSQLGVEVIPCLKGNATWIPAKPEDKPLWNSENATDPRAYIAHADYLFQYVARYGSKKINKQSLKLKDNQEKKSGLNLLQYIENWNEQNKTWEGVAAYFTPYEYAAMASADFDGHQNSIQGNVGVKKADANFKMVMGGLAGLDLDYIKSIKFWADHNRNGEIPFDVINLHFYSKDENKGISPEEDSIRQKLEAIVAYRDEFMPDQEVWITEFGYDTHPHSPQRAPKIRDISREEVQAQWLVRAYLEIAAAGVDKAAMYMLRDVDPTLATKYATSGLTSSKESGWQPKISWFYIYTLKNVLKNMQYVNRKTVEGVNIYEFGNVDDTNKKALVVWSPTSEAKTIKNFNLTINDPVTAVKLTTMKNGAINGVSTMLTVNKSSVSLTVDESPVFVTWDKNGN